MCEVVQKTLDVGGFTISYTETLPKHKDAPDGRVLFCVHGLLSNGRDYDFLARYMAARGYRVIAMDLPGRGESDYFSDPTHYALPYYLPYCVALIAHVTGGCSFDFLGVSLGGIIGMSLHNFTGVNIDRLVLVDIGAEIPAAGLDEVSRMAKCCSPFEDHDEALSFLKWRCAAWGIEDDVIWDHLAQYSFAREEDDTYQMHYDPCIGLALPDDNETIAMWDLWEAIKQPVLLVRGGKSVLLPQEISEQMKVRYSGARLDELVFDACGHVPNLMEDAHLEAVAAWFQHHKA